MEPEDAEPTPSERFIGCLLGQAIGDALAMPVAGLSREEIRERYGEVRGYLPKTAADGTLIAQAGQISANTELSLCLVESLVSSGGFVDPQTAGFRFMQVLQGEHSHFLGMTTRRALEAARESWDFQAGAGGEDDAGVGPAARVTPIGLVHSLGRVNIELLVREVMRSALITHARPEAINGALAVAWAVNLLARRETTWEMLIPEVTSFIDEDEVARGLRVAGRELERRSGPADDERALDVIGRGGYVAEAVPAAFYLAAAYRGNFEGAVLAAASAGGACDAIGAITGALCGTWIGARALPEAFVDGLESRMYILMAAPALYRTAQRRAGLFLQLNQR